MELNYLKEIAEEILEKGNVQLVEQFSVKDSVYLKKIITEMFKAGKPSNTSLSKALYIIDVNTKKDNTKTQDKSKQLDIEININNEYIKMASDVLIGNSLGLLKPLKEKEAIKIMEAAKLLIEENGQICYKRNLQNVIDYVNRELEDGFKVVVNYVDDREVFEVIDAYDVIPIWDVDDVIDPMLISNPTVIELARVLLSTGDLGLLNPLRIDYSLAIIRECIMLLSSSPANVNINNLINYLNMNTEGNYKISYTKYNALELRSMIMARRELVVEPKVIKNIEKKIKNGDLNINSMKK